MELTNSLRVQAPLETAWPVLRDVREVVACFPGAELSEVDDNGDYQGSVQVRVGPFRTSFKGRATVVEADDAAHRLVVRAQAADQKLGSRASALITVRAEAAGPEATQVEIVSDLQLHGRLAQFGRGVLEGVAGQMTASFAERLNQRLAGARPPDAG